MNKSSKKPVLVARGVILLIVGYFVFRIAVPPTDPTINGIVNNSELLGLDKYLEDQGFVPNQGFSTKFPPGTIIQVTSRDQNGIPVAENSPRVFLTSKSCYPGVDATQVDAVLPSVSGTQARGIAIDASALSKYLPKLTLDANITDSYVLVIDEPGIELIPRGEMLGTMSMTCRTALAKALGAGDSIEWFKVVEEVMVAKGFRFRVDWKTDAGAAVDIETRNRVLDQFQNSVAQAIGESNSTPLFKVKDSNNRFAELQTDKHLIFGFRARHFSVIKGGQ